jgi:cytochrome c oxidase subunit II
LYATSAARSVIAASGVVRLVALASAAGLLMAGCSGPQSALDPRGPQAARIASEWWLFFWVCTAVFLAVAGVLLYAVARARRGQPTDAPELEGTGTAFVAGGAILTVLILFVFLVYSASTGRAITTFPADNPLTIEVIGHQWWWEVRYLDPDPSLLVTTANEIHIPVGQPVLFRVTARDVIHSFWVPNLHGKIDLIPGQDNTIWLQADEAGVFRGQCAEFCGLQHALMAFLVVAQPPEEFTSWLEQQRQPAATPTEPIFERGQEVFLRSQCVLCHTVRGTGAFSQVGPDLTHIGGRRTLAAATIPNTPGSMAAWIVDPQHIKPGTLMPATILPPEDLQVLLTYLESLR